MLIFRANTDMGISNTCISNTCISNTTHHFPSMRMGGRRQSNFHRTRITRLASVAVRNAGQARHCNRRPTYRPR